MATRDQERAALAYEHVSAYLTKDKKRQKKYASIVHALPSLLQSAGLCQALYFADSRGDEDQRAIIDHLAVQLARVSPTLGGKPTLKKSGDALLERARKAELTEYLALTDEAMACAAWYRRLVQGVLKIEAADKDSDQAGEAGASDVPA